MKTNYKKEQLCLFNIEDEAKQLENMQHIMINERLERYGVETLMPEEILTKLTGIPLNQARKYICDFGLPELIKFADTMKLSKVQRKKLELLYSFSKILSTSEYKEKEILNSSLKSGEYFTKQLQFLRHEVFAIAILDSQNRLISFDTLFEGTLNECAVYVRQIVRLVIEKNGNAILIGHNHPGGTMNPSNADIQVYKKIKEALNTISVSVVDSIIVADNKFLSFAERGLL